MDIEEFADIIGVDLNVRRIANFNPVTDNHGLPWIASFAHGEIKDDIILTSMGGRGKTPQDAVAAYAQTIKGRLLVINAYSDNRKEFNVPNEWT